jgi:quinol monooxygenase YgiN
MTPVTPLRVIARVMATAEHVARVQEILSALVEPTRRESGCLSYELLQNGSDPAEFVFIEKWTTAAAEQAHFDTPHVLTALKQLAGLLAAEPDIRRYLVVK